ncbi:MAG: 5-bromo-4-chloroindolyl phosphate hydrolysis family protein [bacterium]|nr:5-bromo-4-chloroindolyl phosphate hydrolysis family protein [bacterium]
MAQDDLKIGEQLSKDLKEAVESMDFSKFSETVSDTVNLTLRETKERMERRTQEFGRNRGPAPEQRRNTGVYGTAAQADPWTEHLRPRDEIRPVNQSKQRQLPPKVKSVVKTRPQGRAAGILCTIFGGMGLFGCVLTTMFVIMGVAITQPDFAVGASMIGLFVVLTVAFALLMGVGIHYNRKNSRLSLYARYMRGKEFITFKELAGRTGKTEDFLAKDIKKMLECGMFPGSRMDEEQTCLMFTDEAYKQYQEARQAYAIRQEEEKRLALIQEEEEKALSDSAELKAMIERGDEFLKKIREANDGIPGVEISRKIDNLETIIRQIFKAIRENPDEIDEMDKFMEYYLPTTVKLLETYRRFDQVASPGENILSAKQEIEKTLDTIERAFLSLLDDLYQNSAFDAEADAAVLKTMLEQEGLVKH